MIYLASPYTHRCPDVVDARRRATVAVLSLMLLSGEVVYSPIAHSHLLTVEQGLGVDWTTWEAHCLGMLAVADRVRVLCLPGWESSEGVRAELAFARELGKPVSFLRITGGSDAYWVMETGS